jgi:hypothetical protein
VRGPRRRRRTRRRRLALGLRLIRDGEPIADQDNVSAQPVSFGGAAAPLEIKDDGGTTLLAALTKAGGRVLDLASARSA